MLGSCVLLLVYLGGRRFVPNCLDALTCADLRQSVSGQLSISFLKLDPAQIAMPTRNLVGQGVQSLQSYDHDVCLSATSSSFDAAQAR